MAGRPRAKSRISIRRSIIVIALLLGALSIVAAGALVWTSNQLRDAIVTVNRDIRSLAIVDELQLSVLTYQRVSNFFLAFGDSVWLASRDEITAEQAEQEFLLSQAALQAGSDAERRMIEEARQRLDQYRQDRRRLEALGMDMEAVMESATPDFDALLSVIESLRSLNDSQVSRAYERAMSINRRSNLTGVVVAALLLSALVLVVVGTRRYVVEPIVELEETIARYRRGDERARAEVQGARESADLAQAFNEMAETLARMRDEQRVFAAGIAHDLRNPIGGIQVALHTLAYDRPEDEHRRTIALLPRQFERLTRMVDDLLDATRIEAGSLSLQMKDVDLVRLTEEIVRFYQPTTERHEIVLSRPSRSVTVRADEQRMEQVLANLVSNAIKYSPSGGRIDVRVDADEKEARVSVRDHGIGMSPDDLRDIFSPFHRKRPEVADGVGLGLSVANGLARAHAGRIEVESETGRGSTFTVHLPFGPRPD